MMQGVCLRIKASSPSSPDDVIPLNSVGERFYERVNQSVSSYGNLFLATYVHFKSYGNTVNIGF